MTFEYQPTAGPRTSLQLSYWQANADRKKPLKVFSSQGELPRSVAPKTPSDNNASWSNATNDHLHD